MPLINQTFSQLITFTRASSGTFTGPNGLIQSANTNVPRFDYDSVTLAAKGLLIEEQRTNLLTYSEDFSNAAWVKTGLNTTGTPAWVNVAVSPDGTTTADKLIEDTSTGTHQAAQTITTTAIAYTYSVYAKAAERSFILLYNTTAGFAKVFNLATGSVGTGTVGTVTANINAVGNGWYRCSITGTATAAANGWRSYVLSSDTITASYTGDGTSGLFIWGAQLEAGSFATSYIPTVASQVTRSADVASVNTLSPWYNATEGTLYVETGSAAGTSPRIATFHNGTIDAQIFHQINTSGFAGYNGTFQWQLAAVASVGKVAGAYKVNDIAASLNGGAVATDTSAVIPTGINQLRIGASWNGDGPLNGHIRRITYYPRKLSSAELQAITA